MTADVFPSLPDGRVTAAIVGDNAAANILRSFGIDAMIAPTDARLPSPIAAHADMLCCHVAPGIVLTYDARLADRLRSCGIDARVTAAIPGSVYPNDVALNCARIGDIILCGRDTCAPEIVDIARDSGISLVHTNQGYARCSTAIVDRHSVITADKGICRALRNIGYDVLLISPGHISLPGYDCGFIGGCCGMISRDRMLFFGDIYTHPDGEAIARFLELRGIKPICASSGVLSDVGGFIPVRRELT